MRRQREWAEQARLASRLAKLLDPDYIFWTAVDNEPWSLVHGIKRKERGIRAGVPDLLFWFRDPDTGSAISLAIELKSGDNKLSSKQRAVRDQMRAAGVKWFLCRSSEEVIDTLRAEGVPFRDDVQTSSQQPRISATMRF